jgi:hypothetical protein
MTNVIERILEVIEFVKNFSTEIELILFYKL